MWICRPRRSLPISVNRQAASGHSAGGNATRSFSGETILRDLAGKPRETFRFVDKGQMATIGRSCAIVEIGKLRFSGWFAWLTWLGPGAHLEFQNGFYRNRVSLRDKTDSGVTSRYR